MIWHLDLDEIKAQPREESRVFDDLTEGLGVFSLTVLWVLLLTYQLGPVVLK